MNKLTIGETIYDLDTYEYIHVYDVIAMLGWKKRIGLLKRAKSGDDARDPLVLDNYDWVLSFDEVSNKIYGGDKKESAELLANRVKFDRVRLYLKNRRQKHIMTRANGACGSVTEAAFIPVDDSNDSDWPGMGKKL